MTLLSRLNVVVSRFLQNRWAPVAVAALGVVALMVLVSSIFLSHVQFAPSLRSAINAPATSEPVAPVVAAASENAEAHAPNTALTRHEAWRLAAKAAYQNSAGSLEQLQRAANAGDVEAEYGMGEYYLFESGSNAFGSLPLLSDIQQLVINENTIDIFASVKGIPAATVQDARQGLQRSIDFAKAHENHNLRRAVTWWGKAEHDESEAEGELAKEYWREFNIFMLAVSAENPDPAQQNIMGVLFSVRALDRDCGAIISRLDALTADNTHPSATAFATLGLVYLADWTSAAVHDQARLEASETDCKRFHYDLALANKYAERAAELGDEAGTNITWEHYEKEGNDVKAHYWRQRFREIEAERADLGFPGAEIASSCAIKAHTFKENFDCQR